MVWKQNNKKCHFLQINNVSLHMTQILSFSFVPTLFYNSNLTPIYGDEHGYATCHKTADAIQELSSIHLSTGNHHFTWEGAIKMYSPSFWILKWNMFGINLNQVQTLESSMNNKCQRWPLWHKVYYKWNYIPVLHYHYVSCNKSCNFPKFPSLSLSIY